MMHHKCNRSKLYNFSSVSPEKLPQTFKTLILFLGGSLNFKWDLQTSIQLYTAKFADFDQISSLQQSLRDEPESHVLLTS